VLPVAVERPGSAGRLPTVMSTAESIVITLGCSEVRDSSVLQALSNQRGACAIVVVTPLDVAAGVGTTRACWGLPVRIPRAPQTRRLLPSILGPDNR